GLQVGILDPDQYEIVSGLIEVRIVLWNSSRCSINVFMNGSLNATSVPWVWDTTKASDGWWNISVRVIDTKSNFAQDEIMVYVLNNALPTPRTRVTYTSASSLSTGSYVIDYQSKNYDTTDSFNLTTDRYDVPENGYYLLIATAYLILDPNRFLTGVLSIRNQINFIICLAEFAVDTDVYTMQLTVIITDIYYFSKGDQIEVHLGLQTTNTVLLMGGSRNTYFSIAKLHD
ncbi:MAG: hypothetical protein ACFFA3_18535, partial [Promethearchaeota archaeon]